MKEISINEIYCNDALAFLKEIPRNVVDFCLTDPPYNINMGGNGKKIAGDNMEEKLYFDWLTEIFSEIFKVLKTDSFFVFNTYRKNIGRDLEIIKNSGFDFVDLLCDAHLNSMTHCKFGIDRFDLLIASKKGEPKIKNRRSNVCVAPRAQGISFHPTPKSEQVYEYFIEVFTNRGDLVLDPFVGSGTTATVCKKTGRKFYACDIDPQFVEMAKKRINKTVEIKENTELEIW